MNVTQLSIMQIISDWVHSHQEPITLKEISLQLGVDNASREQIKSSIRALVKKGYIRKAVKGSAYVQLRNASVYNKT